MMCIPFMPEWRNWYTHQTQNLASFTAHVGSSPTSGTKLLKLTRAESISIATRLLSRGIQINRSKCDRVGYIDEQITDFINIIAGTRMAYRG